MASKTKTDKNRVAKSAKQKNSPKNQGGRDTNTDEGGKSCLVCDAHFRLTARKCYNIFEALEENGGGTLVDRLSKVLKTDITHTNAWTDKICVQCFWQLAKIEAIAKHISDFRNSFIQTIGKEDSRKNKFHNAENLELMSADDVVSEFTKPGPKAGT